MARLGRSYAARPVIPKWDWYSSASALEGIINDSLTLTDDIELSYSEISIDTIVFADYADTSLLGFIECAVGDTLALDENQACLIGKLIFGDDELALSDDVVIILALNVLQDDTLVFDDDINDLSALLLDKSDQFILDDSAEAQVSSIETTELTEELSDTLVFSDDTTWLLNKLIEFDDTIELSDAAYLGISLIIADTITLTDETSCGSLISQPKSDCLWMVYEDDLAEVLFSSYLSVDDSLVLDDTAIAFDGIPVVTDDTLDLSDDTLVETENIYTETTAETLSLSDLAFINLLHLVDVAVSLSPSDSITDIAAGLLDSSDELALTDETQAMLIRLLEATASDDAANYLDETSSGSTGYPWHHIQVVNYYSDRSF